MTRRRGFWANVSLVLGLVAGLAACGGGGASSGSGSTGSPPEIPARELEIHAQEITITPPANQAPEAVGTIPDQTLTENGNTISLDVAPYFTDPEGGPLTYSAQSGDPGVLGVGSSGSTITLTPVSPGNTTVTVTADDGHAQAVQTFPATVPEPNRVPEAVGTIPDQTLTENGNTISLDVAPYFSDPDGDSLTYSARSGDPGVLRVSSSGSIITLTPVSPGNTTVTVTAGDGSTEVLQAFRVAVPEPNRAPETMGAIPSQTLTEDGNPLSMDVAPYFSDPDGDSLTYSVQSGDPGFVRVSSSGSTITLTPVSPGNTTVTVTADDGYAEAVQTFRVTVPEPNRDPETMGTIPSQTLTEDGTPLSVDVAPYFSDPDGDSLTYSAQSGDPGVLGVSSSGSIITLTPVSPGNTTVTVTADDGYAEAVQTFRVTVPEPNRDPETMGTIPSQTLTEDGTPLSVDVAPYFSDPDGDSLTYSAQSGDPGVLGVSSSGSIITLTPVSPGNTTVTVTADDGYAEAVQTFRVTVPEPNRDPETMGTIPSQTLTEDGTPLSVDVAPYFSDPDGDSLTYSAQSGDPGVLGVSSSGSIITLTPVSPGNTTVTVTADDGYAEAVQTIDVTVRQRQNRPVTGNSAPPPPPPPPSEPEIPLTGASFTVTGSKPKNEYFPHTFFLSISPEPRGARLARLGFRIEPDGDEGKICCGNHLGGSISVKFRCDRDFTGDATIIVTDSEDRFRESVTVTCQ